LFGKYEDLVLEQEVIKMQIAIPAENINCHILYLFTNFSSNYSFSKVIGFYKPDCDQFIFF